MLPTLPIFYSFNGGLARTIVSRYYLYWSRIFSYGKYFIDSKFRSGMIHSSRKSAGLCLGTVAQPSSKFFGMKSRVMRITPWHFIFVLSGPVIVASRKSLWIGPRIMRIAMRHSALSDRVLYVVFCGSKEQVVRLYAQNGVAPMTDKKSLRDGAILYFPRNSVNTETFSVESYLPIAVSISVTSPDAASSGRKKIALARQTSGDYFGGWFRFSHDALTVAVECARVSPAVTGRRFESLVPAYQG